jgi:hypothetical protein
MTRTDRPVVTVDLDSTLADTRHRHGLVNPNGPTDWVAYSMACPDDPPVAPVAALVRILAWTHRIVIVSGRDEQARALTEEWLARHDIPWFALYLDDHRHEHETHEAYKVATIQHVDEVWGPVAFHVDDWPPVSLACRAAGIHCITVTPPRVIDDFNPDGHLTFV